MRLLFFCTIITVSSLASLSCNTGEKTVYQKTMVNDSIVLNKKTFDDKGQLLTEEMLTNDSIQNGAYKEWKSDRLYCLGNYTNGEKDGQWIYFDALQDTIRIENWFSGKKFGEQLEYYNRIKATGKPILHKFSFNNLEGKELFNADFDIDGNSTNIKGLPLYCAFNKDSLKKDSVFELIAFFGVPKSLLFHLVVNQKDLVNNKYISHQEFSNTQLEGLEETNFAKKLTVEEKYDGKGTYKWELALLINSISGKTLVNDSCVVDVEVY